MPVLITRDNDIDDDGSGTTGTVHNNAWKQQIYNRIDAALAQLQPNNALVNSSTTGVAAVNVFGTSFVIQPYAVNNQWFGDNLYFDGSFRYKVAGAGVLLYFGIGGAGGFAIQTAPVGAAGAVATPVTKFGLTPAGALALAAYGTGGPAFAAGDKYLTVDASGNVHRSAIGPAS